MSKIRIFQSLFTERDRDAGWNVVQAATLLTAALEKRSSSFVIYAALELRMAIEQLVFTIITITKGEMDAETFEECRKKDGLFRVLNEIAPKYSLRCRFQAAAASFFPGVPALGAWDVKSLLRCYSGLSKICHSPLVIRTFDSPDGTWNDSIEYLKEVHAFLAKGLGMPTAVMKFTAAKISIQDIWERFSQNEITLDEATDEMRKRNPNPSAVVKTQKTIEFTFDAERKVGKPPASEST